MLNKKVEQDQFFNKDRRKLLGLAGIAGAGALLAPLLAKAAPTTVIEAGSNVDTASYIIFKDGSTIYAKNGMTGKIDFQGTDAATVINSAMNNLTAGRTWKEKVVIKGDISINSAILVPSYTHIEIQGKIKPVAEIDIFNNKDASNTFIEISGGEMDGNKTVLAGPNLRAIDFLNVSNLIIRNTYIHDTDGCGIWLNNCDNVSITNNHISQCGNGIEGQGILIYNGSNQIRISGNYIYYPSFSGIALIESTGYCSIMNNNIKNPAWHGIITFANSKLAGYDPAAKYDFEIASVGNTILNAGQIGIYYDQYIRRGVISGNVIRGSGSHGICNDIGTEETIITGNTVYDSGNNGIFAATGLSKNIIVNGNLIDTVASGFHGIYVCGAAYGDTKNILVSDNMILNISIISEAKAILFEDADGYRWLNISIIGNFIDTAKYGIVLFTNTGTSGGAIVTNNTILNTATPYSKHANITNVICNNNIGYKTENFGSASVSDGGTIFHGLAKTPVSVRITPSIAREMVSVLSISATNFTIAIKKPDGSAGTPQTIYWEAEA